MATLDEIRAKLNAQNNRNEGGQRSGGDNSMYPFWNTPEGGQSILRFLPDGDPDNTFFWVERLVIKMPFQGVKGEHDRETIVQVPCMEMYGETCPVLAETRAWWKDDSLVDMARKYWKKKSYMFQGFVVESGFEEKEVPENLIRRFMINPSIFEIIKGSLMNPEMEDMPTDFTSGRDFKLIKTNKGGYANYSTSNWSFKTRALSAVEAGAIETHGLKSLREYLPPKPTAEQVEIIKEMFHASVNNEAYDPARWGQHFRPSGRGFDNNNSGGAASAPQATQAAPVSESVNAFAALQKANPVPAAPAPVAEAPAPAGGANLDDLLQRINAARGGQ